MAHSTRDGHCEQNAVSKKNFHFKYLAPRYLVFHDQQTTVSMGFPTGCFPIVFPKPWPLLRLAISMITSFLGLCFSSQSQSQIQRASSAEIYLSTPDPSPITSLMIKGELPVVEFSSFFKKSSGCEGACETCVFCLCWLEARDEVRELGNCHHAFHKECVDEWIDAGRVTCPLCCSYLLPCTEKTNRRWLHRILARVRQAVSGGGGGTRHVH